MEFEGKEYGVRNHNRGIVHEQSLFQKIWISKVTLAREGGGELRFSVFLFYSDFQSSVFYVCQGTVHCLPGCLNSILRHQSLLDDAHETYSRIWDLG